MHNKHTNSRKLRCVTSQKSKDLIYTAVEAWIYELWYEYYATGAHPNAALSNFLHSVMTM
jgi:hypothetical protein